MKSAYKFELSKKGTNSIGMLVPLEVNINIPFKIKRIFYTYSVPSHRERGSHAYYHTKQVLICLSGSLKVKCFDGNKEEIYELNRCDEALYVYPKIWRTTFEHSLDAVLLVLSSLAYNEADYIRDYDKFMEVVKCI